MAREVCLYHHERWDGGSLGYPGHFDSYMSIRPGEKISSAAPLKNNEIPSRRGSSPSPTSLDALVHKRVYKAAWTIDDTFREIEKERGRQFDPDVVDAFLQIRTAYWRSTKYSSI